MMAATLAWTESEVRRVTPSSRDAVIASPFALSSGTPLYAQSLGLSP